MPDIFISYRRSDNPYAASRLFETLCKKIAKDRIFIDFASIYPGYDFDETIKKQLSNSHYLLAVIGSGWIHATDKKGNRRLDNKDDYVRLEIATALANKIPVVPLLLDNVKIPELSELPHELKALNHRQAFSLTYENFEEDVFNLISSLLKDSTTPQLNEVDNTNTKPIISDNRSYSADNSINIIQGDGSKIKIQNSKKKIENGNEENNN